MVYVIGIILGLFFWFTGKWYLGALIVILATAGHVLLGKDENQ